MSERAATLGRRLVMARRIRDDLARQLDAAKATHAEAESQMWERLDDDGISTVTMPLGVPYGKVQFVKQERVRAIVVNPTRAVAAIKAEKLEKGLLDEAAGIRQKALTDDLKARLRDDRPFLDGVDVHFTRYVTVTLKKESE